MAKKQPPWGALIGWVSRYEKLLMSGAGLKLIVRCLSYQGNIIADLLCASRIIKGREGYQWIITPGCCGRFSAACFWCSPVIQQKALCALLRKNAWKSIAAKADLSRAEHARSGERCLLAVFMLQHGLLHPCKCWSSDRRREIMQEKLTSLKIEMWSTLRNRNLIWGFPGFYCIKFWTTCDFNCVFSLPFCLKMNGSASFCGCVC